MFTHDRMRNWRKSVTLGLGRWGFAVPAGTREVEIVDCGQACDARLPFRGKVFVGRIDVCKFSEAPGCWHGIGVHHGGKSGCRAPGAVRVPVERALVRMSSVWLAVLVDIGEHVDFRASVIAVVLVHDVCLNFAETSRESNLGGGFQVDVAKHDQLVGEKGLVYAPKERVGCRLLKREVTDLKAK
jgi:hypothetical protein